MICNMYYITYLTTPDIIMWIANLFQILSYFRNEISDQVIVKLCQIFFFLLLIKVTVTKDLIVQKFFLQCNYVLICNLSLKSEDENQFHKYYRLTLCFPRCSTTQGRLAFRPSATVILDAFSANQGSRPFDWYCRSGKNEIK